MGAPTRCSRCGTIQERAVKEIREKGKKARTHLRYQRALSDLYFLIGLLLGGPMITIGGQLRLGLFLVLIGGMASVLRRYTEWSNVGSVVISILLAGVVATAVVEPEDGEEDEGAEEEARVAFVRGLSEGNPDLIAEARGPGAVAVWFHLSQQDAGECGSYPGPETRDHLAELGFLRVVVAAQNQTGGMCSYRP